MHTSHVLQLPQSFLNNDPKLKGDEMRVILVGMLIVFVSMLPSVPVRAYVPPYWQHFLIKAEWAFIIACALLFDTTTSETDMLESFSGYLCIVVVAPLAGLGVSAALTSLVLGKIPEAKNPPTDEYMDVIYNWSRKAVEYRVKRLMIPYACGIALALTLYAVFG